MKSFQAQTTQFLGWSFTITNGHSGYIDILIGLGTAGLILLIFLLLQTFYRTGKSMIVKSRMEEIFPFLVTTYVFTANLTVSLFLEFETFHWMLLVMALISTTPTVKD